MKLRKEGSSARRRALARKPKQFGIAKFKGKSVEGVELAGLRFDDIEKGPGVYLVRDESGKAIYAGEAEQLRRRIENQFSNGPLEMWLERDSKLQLCLLTVETTLDYRLARQSLLLKWHKPRWNQVEYLAA